MAFLSPIWLLLALPLGVSMWLWRMPSRLLTWLRMAVLVLLLLGLSGLAVSLPSRAGTVVVVADRSRSMPPASRQAQREAIDLIRQRMDENNRLAVVSFGERPAVEHPPQSGEFGGFVHEVGPDASDLHGGLERALSLIGRDTPGRVIVLTDGRWTGRAPAAMAARAASREIAIDYRLIERPATGDLAIASIDAPPSVDPREAYMITAWVGAPTAREVVYQLRRGEKPIASGRRSVPAGLSRLIFRDSAANPSTLAYTLTVRAAGQDAAEKDPVPENNRARALVGVNGAKPVLLLTRKPDSAFGRLLKSGGLDVHIRQPGEVRWSIAALSNYAAVLNEAVPAQEIGRTGMENLAQWVGATGSGLMMTGGKTGYGPGGYFRSPLEPIMPVSMELRREHRKHRLAIVIAMDRSGSMSMSVGGGRTKMDLANLAAAQVVEMLSPMDEVGVLAVDSSAHEIVGLQPLDDKSALRGRILGIGSMGGGIFVFNALSNAASMLQDSSAGARHIILLADAADAEQPGKYKELLAQCERANITCSVIGLGTKQDRDAAFLQDIARRGGGRVYFTTDPQALPRLFAQDTFVVARSSFIEEQTPIETTAALRTLTGRDYPDPPSVGGYNLTYLREDAQLAMLTDDEYNAPVVAAWQAGAGRVLCYTPQADGEFTGPIAGWPRVGDLLTGLARWTAGQRNELPDGMLLTQQLSDGIVRVALHLNPDRPGQSLDQTPTATILRGTPGRPPQKSETTLEWTSPDTLSLNIELSGTETAITTVKMSGVGPVSLPPVTMPYSPEFRPVDDDRGPNTLHRLAAATAGKERVDLGAIWGALPQAPHRLAIGSWLLIAAAITLLLEVLERRTGVLSTGRFRLTRDPETSSTTTAPGWLARRFAWLSRHPSKRDHERRDPSRPGKSRHIPGDAASSAGPSSQPGAPAPHSHAPPPRADQPVRPSEADPAPTANVMDALGQARQRARTRTHRRR